MHKIDFIIVGAQKSGTTALYNYLLKHSDVSMSNVKEIHFFDEDRHFQKNTNYEIYHQHFDFSDPFKIRGEVTPIYAYWDNAIKRIYNYNKDIKIIYILRNPIERAFSHWNMEYRRNNDNSNFYSAIKTEPERCKEALPKKHRVYSYLDRGYYSEQLRNIYRYFDKRNVLVLLNEDLHDKTDNTLNQLTDFLEISDFKGISKELVFSLKYETKLKIKEHQFLRETFFYETESLAHMLQRDLSGWMKIKKKKVLFYRDYRGYQGGHQKVYDYYTHFKQHPYFEVDIAFSQHSVFDDTNPWKERDALKTYDLNTYDIFFIAGEDWNILENYDYSKKTVINFIQGIRHTVKESTLYQHLKKEALRICVSAELTQAVIETAQVDKDIHTIPNGINIEIKNSLKIYDFFILGVKNTDLALSLQNKLLEQGYRVACTVQKINKKEVHNYMQKSHISILLPSSESEGFYLPPLESMALSDITVVPDAIGNRSFCLHKSNCYVPGYTLDSLYLTAIEAYSELSTQRSIQIKQEALKTVKKYTLERERTLFYALLGEIDYE